MAINTDSGGAESLRPEVQHFLDAMSAKLEEASHVSPEHDLTREHEQGVTVIPTEPLPHFRDLSKARVTLIEPKPGEEQSQEIQWAELNGPRMMVTEQGDTESTTAIYWEKDGDVLMQRHFHPRVPQRNPRSREQLARVFATNVMGHARSDSNPVVLSPLEIDGLTASIESSLVA
ncbi:MAG: hypothetical protein ACXWLH_01410 [Candidatus Saccharimonadales bacterium]